MLRSRSNQVMRSVLYQPASSRRRRAASTSCLVHQPGWSVTVVVPVELCLTCCEFARTFALNIIMSLLICNRIELIHNDKRFRKVPWNFLKRSCVYWPCHIQWRKLLMASFTFRINLHTSAYSDFYFKSS